ncbi:sigma-70 family RNA polymerase sigma factor [Lacibacter luteus]|uniref:Sigma-70 family RNA polymerase sigma factor n=1 Tax=Lacibacter luteus TaxID=2508719 RepID=A0A4Q1CNA7_9BACT|nr:sigma-70 family RNA polymerase sigma factor [Lacibacter luteus]RXK62598.1 sigma-70 family RNA polymerase sigma factor [Lacibacter luteus]
MNTQLDIIIAGCKENNIHCQEQLYKLCYPDMIKLCSRYAKDLDEAGAIYNNAMLKVFKEIIRYKEEGKFMGWVRIVTVRCCLDFIKTTTRFKTIKIELIESEVVFTDVEIISGIAVNEIRKIISELPKATSTVFNLFAYEGFTHKQIAELLGISEGTSKWHVNDARRILKQRLLPLLTDEIEVNAAG